MWSVIDVNRFDLNYSMQMYDWTCNYIDRNACLPYGAMISIFLKKAIFIYYLYFYWNWVSGMQWTHLETTLFVLDSTNWKVSLSAEHREGSGPWIQTQAESQADRHPLRWTTSSCPPWRSPCTASRAPCPPRKATPRRRSPVCAASPPPTKRLWRCAWRPKRTVNCCRKTSSRPSAWRSTAARGNGCMTWTWPWTGCGRLCHTRTDRRFASSPKSPPCCWRETTSWCWATPWKRWSGWWVRSMAAAGTTAASTRRLVGLWRTRGPCRDTRRLPTPHTRRCTTRSSPHLPFPPPPSPLLGFPPSHRSDPITDFSKRPLQVQDPWAAVSNTGASAQGCPVRAACAKSRLRMLPWAPWPCRGWQATPSDSELNWTFFPPQMGCTDYVPHILFIYVAESAENRWKLAPMHRLFSLDLQIVQLTLCFIVINLKCDAQSSRSTTKHSGRRTFSLDIFFPFRRKRKSQVKATSINM